ncbi:hypothetical protein BGP75_17750 [Motiliproteus sp. MSK22-1]|nr:hypothetical protein BGP75_17750 [Motiliproteus sp. MSK22-1]
MLLPDYNNSIVNLVSSLVSKDAPVRGIYPQLPVLDEYRLDQRPVVLLVIDGLGYNFLCQHSDSFLYQALAGQLTSVFPTTTATAVTALALGVPAQQHGITGWFTYFRELGCVAAPLPFTPRGGGRDFSELGVRAEALLDAAALLPTLSRPATLVNPCYIADSPYSQALFGGVDRQSHRHLSGLFDALSQALAQPGNPLVWSYWTELDGMAHQYGINSEQVAKHFRQIDREFADFSARIAGSGAAIVVTADHGLIDTAPDRTVHVDQHPKLAEMLQLPLCGEPRAAFCYLKSGYEDAFDQYVESHLTESICSYRSRDVLEAGWFGLGEPSQRLPERIGDRVLLPRDNWIIKDRLLQEQSFEQIGVHGGLSEEELLVPLVVVEP